MGDYYSIRWVNGVVSMLDQRRLPNEEMYLELCDCNEVAQAIRDMIIRGAPAIGVAAGYGLALSAYHSLAEDTYQLIDELFRAAAILKASRPTAINLFGAINRIMHLVDEACEMSVEQLRQEVVAEAKKISDEDIQMNKRIAINGQQFIPAAANVIHHCNTGALATAGYGTAMGVIRAAHESGKKIHVFVDESRPRLQGLRLTAWELGRLGIPYTVIVDGASGYIMRNNKIDACLVGCDRIASNGDVANKIGTYNLAVLAAAHHIPFYSVGPTTTIDMSIKSGDQIPIEQRSESEITTIGDVRIAPQGAQVENPSFDITPAQYITAIITEAGVAYPPYEQTLAQMMERE